jgi:hypothetical protein
VRTCTSRPFIEVVPLVEVDEPSLREVQKGRRPQYAYIPGAAGLKLVADLDRVMTVEKPVLTSKQWYLTFDNRTKKLTNCTATGAARYIRYTNSKLYSATNGNTKSYGRASRTSI